MSRNKPRQYRKKDIITTKDYRLQKLSKLGEGTYGVVYKARNLKTKEILAIKEIRSTPDDETEGLSATTVREIAILKQLSSHENIVTLHDIIYHNKRNQKTHYMENRLYLLFEFCDMDLKKYLNKSVHKTSTSCISSQDIKYIVYQIILGIAACHKHHVFHRDLKPHNILINAVTKQVKIADFGLARTYSYGYIEAAGSKRDYTHEVITLWYRPCEILLGDNKYGPAVDIWGIACIFAEIVNDSEPLFTGDSEISQLLHIFQLCGTPNPINWPSFRKLKYYSPRYPMWNGKEIGEIVPDLEYLGQDLLARMLKINPSKRITARQALRHPYFNSVKASDSYDIE